MLQHTANPNTKRGAFSSNPLPLLEPLAERDETIVGDLPKGIHLPQMLFRYSMASMSTLICEEDTEEPKI